MIVRTLVTVFALSAVLISSPPAAAKGGSELQEQQEALAAELAKSRKQKASQATPTSFFDRLFGTAPQATPARPAAAAPKK